MMGKRVFAPKLYYQFSLDDLVPKNHLLRQISSAIDFSFVYSLTKSHYSHTGQPSVDPVVIFKTMLIAFSAVLTSKSLEERNSGDCLLNVNKSRTFVEQK